jgi:hypothetical protein
VNAYGHRVRRIGAVVERHPALTVSVVTVIVAIPYLVAGPHFLADDYVWLRNAHFDGWWNAGGPRVAGRPGGWLVAALTFGAVGAHPAVLYVVQTVLRVIAAVLLRRCLAEFMAARYALAVTLVWIVMPNHLALEMWLSSIAAPIAIALLAAGITALARALRADPNDRRQLVLAYVLLAAAVGVYELTAGVAALAVVAVPYLVHKRPQPKLVAFGLGAVAVPALWAAIRSTVYDHSATGKLDPRLVLPGHLSLGFAPFGVQGRLVTLVALLLIVSSIVRLARRDLRPSTGFAERLVVAGAVVIVAGVAPLASFATNFFGLHDRLVLVSGIGAAMVWTGGALLVASLVGERSSAVLVVAGVAFVAIAIPIRAVRIQDFVDAGRQAMQEADRIGATVNGRRAIDVPGPVAVVDRVWGLNDGWNTTAAVQFVTDDPGVSVGVIIDGQRTGPPPDDPRASF